MTRLLLRATCLVLGLSMIALVMAVPGAVVAYPTHEPILIDGNKGFTAANGVIGGSGTAEDPYLIAGWQINPTSGAGVRIAHTTAHFEIRDLVIQGTSSSFNGPKGIWLDQAQNFEVRAVEVSNCMAGILVHKAADAVIQGCSAHDNGLGIYVSYSREVAVEQNTVLSNTVGGIDFDCSESCSARGNVVALSGGGVGILYSRWITVSENAMIRDGVRMSGRTLPEFSSHTITPDNTVGELPVYYYSGARGMRLEGIQAGQIILAGCQNIQIVGLTLRGSSVGVELGFSYSVSFDSCIFHNNSAGVIAWYSAAIDFQNCQFIGNRDGIDTYLSSRVTIDGCQFSENAQYGIMMYRTDVASITDSMIADSNVAIYNQECTRVVISGNVIAANSYGIDLWFCARVWVTGNAISQSSLSGWGMGISILDGAKIVVVRNNFVANQIQAMATEGSDIMWDDGTSCGNFWDDYSGVDANGDLIGDTPYLIDVGYQDNFPSMVPFVIQSG